MTIQVLIVTMNQCRDDYSLLEKMNIQSDAIVCNQCDRNEFVEFFYKGHRIKWYSFAEKGVGLNRNTGLMRSTADILVMADDDMVFRDGYVDIVLDWMRKENTADVLLFDLMKNGELISHDTKIKKIKKHNFGKYGAARMVLRTRNIRMYGIAFNTMFGGGCPYSCGEDSLFLYDCLNKGLRLVAIPEYIAELTILRESTWFTGLTDKFFYDKGVLYGVMYHKMGRLYSLYHCIKHRNKYTDYGWYKACKQMFTGVKSVNK